MPLGAKPKGGSMPKCGWVVSQRLKKRLSAYWGGFKKVSKI